MIQRAKSAGFCGGVKTAIKKATEGTLHKRCVIGSLVHNKFVIERVKCLGIEFVEKPDSSFDEVVISAHGISKNESGNLDGYKVIDATCTNVQKIIDLAKSLSDFDCLLMVGDKTHSEVKNVTSYAKNFFVLDKHAVEDKKIIEILKQDFEKIALVFQTTVSKEAFESYKNFIEILNDSRVIIYDTICQSVQRRIDESVEIAKVNDVMIVVGDRESANCLLLYEECKRVNSNTLFVSCFDELPPDLPEKIGITAGASTDTKDIDEIVKKIELRGYK